MEYPKLTFTVTTCGRPHLFIKTMNSFLDTCQDLDLIQYWILGDDNSPKSDIEDMKKRYPFFSIVKSPGQGQAANLNNLFSCVKTEWIMHCEDDWIFLKKDNYIRKMLDIVLENPQIKNAVLRNWVRGDEGVTSKGMKYNIHKYDPSAPRKEIVDTDAWWYGYSLNPGLQHKPTIDLLGKYREYDIKRRKWDRPQAIEYRRLGYRRANLLGEYIRHIGYGESCYKRRGEE